MKILVTGANGHIGSHTVRFLLKDGHKVVAFVREGADVRSLEGLEIEFRMGDIRDSSAVESAVKGCNVVVHHAAVYKFWEKNHSDIIEPAIRGAENIFNAAKKAGVKRIVYTSSAAAVGLNDGPECRTSDDWNDDAKNPYYVAKTESEKTAWKIAKETGVEMVVICPCVVLGPQDYRITPSTEIINSMANRRLPHMLIFKGGYNIVDVRDVAYVHARAVDMKGIVGQRFIVGSENLSIRDIGKLVKKFTGTTSLYLPLPRFLFLFSMGFLEIIAKLLGLKPLVPTDLVYQHVNRWSWYESGKTNSTFGLRPRGAEQIVEDCISWLDEQGRLKPSVSRRRAKLMAASVPG